jgi:hypothetical protein
MKYSARVANVIVGTQNGKPSSIEVKIDGSHVPEINLGSDLMMKDSVTYADIEWTRIYNLIKTTEPETHEIEIIPRTENILFYTFLFS